MFAIYETITRPDVPSRETASLFEALFANAIGDISTESLEKELAKRKAEEAKKKEEEAKRADAAKTFLKGEATLQAVTASSFTYLVTADGKKAQVTVRPI